MVLLKNKWAHDKSYVKKYWLDCLRYKAQLTMTCFLPQCFEMIRIFSLWSLQCGWVNKDLTLSYYFLIKRKGLRSGMKESYCLSRLPLALARLDLLSLHESPGASLVAQLVKNPPAMQETWDLTHGSEEPLETGKATSSSILT